MEHENWIRLQWHMQVRTTSGDQVGSKKSSITGSKNVVKLICCHILQNAFDSIVKGMAIPIAMPENIYQMIQNAAEEFNLYDTQVIIFEVLIDCTRNAIALVLTKKMAFNGLGVDDVEKLTNLELNRIERQCQDVIVALQNSRAVTQ